MAGLDIRERFRVLRLLDRLRDLVSIIFSTHHPEEAAGICDEILILNRGRAVAWGNPSEITARAAGHVFEATISLKHLPLEADWRLVSAERDGEYLHLRTVGSPPPNGRTVAPCLTDAYVFLTFKDESGE
jgi:ABC-2 type transport system ATP-binding protein